MTTKTPFNVLNGSINSAQALVGAESGREELWTLAVEQTLEKIGLYHKLLHIRLVGILLLIYIKPHSPKYMLLQITFIMCVCVCVCMCVQYM